MGAVFGRRKSSQASRSPKSPWAGRRRVGGAGEAPEVGTIQSWELLGTPLGAQLASTTFVDHHRRGEHPWTDGLTGRYRMDFPSLPTSSTPSPVVPTTSWVPSGVYSALPL